MLLLLTGFGCAPSRPSLQRYDNMGTVEKFMSEDQRVDWSMDANGDLESTIALLENSTDDMVVEYARSARDGLVNQRSDRDQKIRALIEKDMDRVDFIYETGLMGTEDEIVVIGNTRSIRKDLMEEYRLAEEQGKIGEAIRIAGALQSMESMMSPDEIASGRIDSLHLVKRNQDRMKMIRLIEPALADQIRDPDGTMKISNDFQPEWPVMSSRERGVRRNNTTRFLDLLMTEHVSEPDLKSLHESGIDEILFMCSVLRENEHPIPTKFTDHITLVIQDMAGGDTRKLVEEIDRSELELAGDSLPAGFSLRAFGDGAASSLDKQTSVIWPEEYSQYTRAMSSEYRGIGSRVSLDEQGQIILNPSHGSPARKAGIRDGDIVLAIEGVNSEQMTTENLTSMATESGRDFMTLLVRHEDGGQEEITIEIGSVMLPQVTGWTQIGMSDEDGEPVWSWLADRDGRIAYLKPDGFRVGGDVMIRLAIQEAQLEAVDQGGRIEGMILDLRGNPGGHVYVALELCNIFMRYGKAFESHGRDGKQQVKLVNARYGELEGMPLVILVDDQSASASELVSGILRESDDVLVIGERTYGKGSVQTIHPCVTDDCLARITSAWYTIPVENNEPKSTSTEWKYVDREMSPSSWGVVPDLIVPVSMEESDQIDALRSAWHTGIGRDRPADDDQLEDPTVDLALALLRDRIINGATAKTSQSESVDSR